MHMKKRNLQAPSTKGDIDDAVAQIATVISKTLEDYPTKDDLKATEKRLEGKIDDVASDVSDMRRRVIDLETDTITRNEFNELKRKVLPV